MDVLAIQALYDRLMGTSGKRKMQYYTISKRSLEWWNTDGDDSMN